MIITINADDAGISKSITDKILEAYQRGSVNRISILPNGEAFDYAIKKIREIGNINYAVHLNLIEGISILNKTDIPLLVDEKNYFKKTFFTLLITYIFCFNIRKKLVNQIEMELDAQFKKIEKSLESKNFDVDSHRYTHLLPFVFRIILSLKSKYNIQSIRILREPFFWHQFYSGEKKIHSLTSLIKYFVLQFLSKKCLKIQSQSSITHSDWMIGVLYSGRMFPEIIREILTKIILKDPSRCRSVEILFHPGPADSREVIWGKNTKYVQFYYSSEREIEEKILLSQELRDTLSDF